MDSGGPHQFERDLRQSSRPEGPAKFSSVTVGEGTLLRQGLDPTRKEIFQRRLWPLVAERFKFRESPQDLKRVFGEDAARDCDQKTRCVSGVIAAAARRTP
jgi:hypothetical protein